jgi:hypothetical protein
MTNAKRGGRVVELRFGEVSRFGGARAYGPIDHLRGRPEAKDSWPMNDPGGQRNNSWVDERRLPSSDFTAQDDNSVNVRRRRSDRVAVRAELGWRKMGLSAHVSRKRSVDVKSAPLYSVVGSRSEGVHAIP